MKDYAVRRWILYMGVGIWDLGLGMSDLGFGTWDLIFGTWDGGLEI